MWSIPSLGGGFVPVITDAIFPFSHQKESEVSSFRAFTKENFSLQKLLFYLIQELFHFNIPCTTPLVELKLIS